LDNRHRLSCRAKLGRFSYRNPTEANFANRESFYYIGNEGAKLIRSRIIIGSYYPDECSFPIAVVSNRQTRVDAVTGSTCCDTKVK